MYKIITGLLLISLSLLAETAKETAPQVKRKSGGYRTFQEMKEDNPSLSTEYYLDPLFDVRKDKRITDYFVHKSVDRKDNLKEWSARKHGAFWGCTMKNKVYITPQTETPYLTVPLHIYKKYSWFTSAEISEDFVTVSTRGDDNPLREDIPKAIKLKAKTFYVIMETGEQGILTPAKLKEFISADAELLETYNKSARQEELMTMFLEIYHRNLATK